MARAKPKPGDTYTLVGTVGDGPLAVPEGTKVTVREVVAADEPGAHDDSEDAVVVEYEENGAVRAFSIGLSQADDFLQTPRSK